MIKKFLLHFEFVYFSISLLASAVLLIVPSSLSMSINIPNTFPFILMELEMMSSNSSILSLAVCLV